MKKRSYLAAVLALSFVFILAALPVYAEQPKVEGNYLDSFDREKLAVDGSNNVLSDGTTIYWNQSGAGNFSIVDGALKAEMNQGGFFRFATNNTIDYKYLIIRIKGDNNAVNDKIYTRMGVAEIGDIDDNAARGDKSFAQILGTDGKAIPNVSSEWQDMVIDLEKNGFKFGGGSNAFQIGSWQDMNLDIDYLFMTNQDPNAAVKKAESTTANPKTGDEAPIAAALAVLVISAAILVVFFRKKVNA